MRVTTVDDRCRLFFDLFSTISNFAIFPKKVTGPDASENVFPKPDDVRTFSENRFFEFSEKRYWARSFGKAFWVVRGNFCSEREGGC